MDEALIERLLAGPADAELSPRELAFLTSFLHQIGNRPTIREMRDGTYRYAKLALLRDFNRQLYGNRSPSGSSTLEQRPGQASRENYVQVIGGNVQMGDNFHVNGNVTGSAIGSGATVNARDITAYNQLIETGIADDSLRSVLKQAREELERAELSDTDKGDAADELGKITEELQKPKPNGGRIQRAWTTIQGIVATVATILASAETIRKWLP